MIELDLRRTRPRPFRSRMAALSVAICLATAPVPCRRHHIAADAACFTDRTPTCLTIADDGGTSYWLNRSRSYEVSVRWTDEAKMPDLELFTWKSQASTRFDGGNIRAMRDGVSVRVR